MQATATGRFLTPFFRTPAYTQAYGESVKKTIFSLPITQGKGIDTLQTTWLPLTRELAPKVTEGEN
ncbi:MAG: hypothetical protein ACI39E_08355, partial [Acutalibacteraceae bacterium]